MPLSVARGRFNVINWFVILSRLIGPDDVTEIPNVLKIVIFIYLL